MSPTQNPTPTNNMNMTFTDIPLRQPQPAQLRALQTTQPPPFQSMDPRKPHPESDMSLRGGDRGGCCPGRFCFCIPCPIPCDCCIIPL